MDATEQIRLFICKIEQGWFPQRDQWSIQRLYVVPTFFLRKIPAKCLQSWRRPESSPLSSGCVAFLPHRKWSIFSPIP